MPFNFNLILFAVFAAIFTFGSGFIMGDSHRADIAAKDLAASIANANASARAIEQKVSIEHSRINKLTLGERDAIEKNRQQFMVQYAANAFGLRQSNTGLSASTKAGTGVGDQALRFSRSDAEFLINFASECAVEQAERNEVISKYEAL
jgi:hypothetical protein